MDQLKFHVSKKLDIKMIEEIIYGIISTVYQRILVYSNEEIFLFSLWEFLKRIDYEVAYSLVQISLGVFQSWKRIQNYTTFIYLVWFSTSKSSNRIFRVCIKRYLFPFIIWNPPKKKTNNKQTFQKENQWDC